MVVARLGLLQIDLGGLQVVIDSDLRLEGTDLVLHRAGTGLDPPVATEMDLLVVEIDLGLLAVIGMGLLLEVIDLALETMVPLEDLDNGLLVRLHLQATPALDMVREDMADLVVQMLQRKFVTRDNVW
jgi:hypothetical protein